VAKLFNGPYDGAETDRTDPALYVEISGGYAALYEQMAGGDYVFVRTVAKAPKGAKPLRARQVFCSKWGDFLELKSAA
jgi:hypothetical protein